MKNESSTAPIVEEFYSRHPAAALSVSTGAAHPTKTEELDLGLFGLVLTAGTSTAGGDAFTTRKLRKIPLPNLDESVSLCFAYAQNQLLLTSKGEDAPGMCNLTRSNHRDRFVLQHGMRIRLNSHPLFSVTRNRRRRASEECVLPIQLRVARRVSFSDCVAMRDVDGRETTAQLNAGGDDDADAEAEMEDLGYYIHSSSSNEAFELSLPHRTQLFVLDNGTLAEHSKGRAIAAITLASRNTLHLVLPLRAYGGDEIPPQEFQLELAPNTSFPVLGEDVFQLGPYWIQVHLCGKLVRSVPSRKGEARKINTAYRMQSMALETGWDEARVGRWSKVVACRASSKPMLWWDVFTKQQRVISIGRRMSEILIPDCALAAQHCHLERVSSPMEEEADLYTANAVKNFKDVYQLVGKRRAYKRALPIPLRLGDIFCAGKTMFCVVFQQRGNRIAFEGSDADAELAQRIAAPPPALDTVPSFHDLASLLAFFNLSIHDNMPLLALLSLRGPSSSQYYLANALETIIGSERGGGGGGATICITNDRTLSPMHCRIWFDEPKERWMLEDLESENGTFIKVGLGDPLLLCPGDVLCMGTSVITVLGSSISSSKEWEHMQLERRWERALDACLEHEVELDFRLWLAPPPALFHNVAAMASWPQKVWFALLLLLLAWLLAVQ